MIDILTVDDFAPLTGQAFALPGDGAALTLLDVTPSRCPVPPPRRRGFSLLFRGPEAAALGQGIVPLIHPRFGTLEVFLVPVGAGAGTRDYEAVFN